MRRTLLMIGLALALAGAGTARADKTCQMQEIGELPVSVGDGVSAEASVNGRLVRMIVDTSSFATLLTPPTARRLGLEPHRFKGVELYRVGGDDEGDLARIETFGIGDRVARDYHMLISDRHDLVGADGLLGSFFLLQTDVEFDLPEGKVRFFKPRDCQGDQVVYWGKAYSVAPMVNANKRKIEVSVLLNGKPTLAEMDTGAGASVVSPDGAAVAGVTPASDGVSGADPLHATGPQEVTSFTGVFSTFAFGDETIRNARLRIADLFNNERDAQFSSYIGATVYEEPRMRLGADFFRSHRVYVSMGQRKVYVS